MILDGVHQVVLGGGKGAVTVFRADIGEGGNGHLPVVMIGPQLRVRGLELKADGGHGAVGLGDGEVRRGAPAADIDGIGILLNAAPFAGLIQRTAKVEVVIGSKAVEVVAEFRRGDVAPVTGQLGSCDGQHHRTQHDDNVRAGQHRRAPPLLRPQGQGGLRLPGKARALVAGLIAFPQADQAVNGDIAAHTIPQHRQCAGEPGGVAQAAAVAVRDGQAHDPFAGRGAPQTQQQRLQKDHDQQGHHRVQQAGAGAVPDGAAAGKQLKEAAPQGGVQEKIQYAGEEAPPRGTDGGDHVGGQGVLFRGAVQRVQILLGIQRLIGDAVGAHVPAYPFRAVDVLPLRVQGGDVAIQRVEQVIAVIVQGLDLLQGDAKAPQQPDALEYLQIMVGIVPIAVDAPCRGKQPFGLVKPDIGPGHTGTDFDILDGHGATSWDNSKL